MSDTMQKVFYVASITDSPIAYGETDGHIHEGEYMKVGSKMIHAAFVFLDTQENVALLRGYREEHQMWKDEEPNVYVMLNKMQRPAKKF